MKVNRLITLDLEQFVPVVSFLATSSLCDFQNLALGEIVKTPLIVGTYQTCADVNPADPVK